jgi:hypothetical protein
MPADAPQVDARCAADSPAKAAGKLRLLTLGHLDGRTRSMIRVRSLMAAIERDLGGNDHLTLGQRQLCQRAAVLGALIEDTEARWAGGEVIAIGDYLAAINAQRRVLATLGLQRVARDVTDLHEYLASRDRGPPGAISVEGCKEVDAPQTPISEAGRSGAGQ